MNLRFLSNSVMIVIVGVLFQCNNTNISIKEGSYDVFVAGYTPDSIVYWKNGKMKAISVNRNNALGNMFVKNDTVRVIAQGKCYGCKYDLQPLNIINAGNATIATDICVDAGIEHVIGWVPRLSAQPYESPPIIPAYWKNGKPQYLNCVSDSYNTKIYVIGVDTHTIGSSLAIGVQEYHFNCKLNYSYPAIGMSFTDLFVDGGNVFISMTSSGGGGYSKNGNFQYLDNCRYAYGIFAAKSNVYVAGVNSTGDAAYWKNGTEVTLTHGLPSAAYSIFCVGETVFTTGQYGDMAAYWKDEKLNELGKGLGFAIFAVEK